MFLTFWLSRYGDSPRLAMRPSTGAAHWIKPCAAPLLGLGLFWLVQHFAGGTHAFQRLWHTAIDANNMDNGA